MTPNHDNSPKKLLERIAALEHTLADYESFKIVYETIPHPIFITSHDGAILTCNKAALVTFGYTTREMKGRLFWSFLPKDSVDRLPQFFKEENDTGKQHLSTTIRKKNSEFLPVKIHTSLFTLNGETQRIITVLDRSGHSITNDPCSTAGDTDSKQHRFMTELVGIPDYIIEIDLERIITSVNEIFLNRSGYTRKELLKGIKIESIVPSEYRGKVLKTVQRIISGKDSDFNEYLAVTKDGSLIPVIVNSTLMERDGVPVGIRINAIDITDNKQLEKKISTMEKFHTLGELSGSVTHDIKNILAIILGYCELFSQKSRDEKEFASCREIINKIKEAAGEGIGLFKKLRAQTMHSVKQEHELLDLNRLLEESLDQFTPSLRNKNVLPGVDMTMSRDLNLLPPVRGIAVEIKEVFNNIILNAIEAMQSGGCITVTSGVTDTQIIITVADTGPGMSEETLLSIFEPFYTSKGEKGTGLGLFISSDIINKYRGDIEVESTPGVGSTFRIILPLPEKSEAASADVLSPVVKVDKGSVLVVDDEEKICHILAQYLQHEGYRVFTATSGRDGLDLFRAHAPGTVITDLNMPDHSGLEISRHIRVLSPETTIILLTGDDSPLDGINFEQFIDHVIEKPLDFKRLSCLLREA